jgi:hypothetical protein
MMCKKCLRDGADLVPNVHNKNCIPAIDPESCWQWLLESGDKCGPFLLRYNALLLFTI